MSYHPGQFYSDTEEEDDDDSSSDADKNGEDEKKENKMVINNIIDSIINNVNRAVLIETMVDKTDEAAGAEAFSFPFDNSTFQFPHTDYDEIVDTRRSSERKRGKAKISSISVKCTATGKEAS